MPYMEDLQLAVRQHTQMSVMVNGEALVVERLASHNDVPNLIRVGGRLPLHAASPGLLLLAFAPTDEQSNYLSEPLASFTSATITDPERLRVMLAGIRRQRFAVVEETMVAGSAGVAAPIQSQRGDVLAVLSITYRMDVADYRQLLPALLTACRGITRAIGDPL